MACRTIHHLDPFRWFSQLAEAPPVKKFPIALILPNGNKFWPIGPSHKFRQVRCSQAPSNHGVLKARLVLLGTWIFPWNSTGLHLALCWLLGEKHCPFLAELHRQWWKFPLQAQTIPHPIGFQAIQSTKYPMIVLLTNYGYTRSYSYTRVWMVYFPEFLVVSHFVVKCSILDA